MGKQTSIFVAGIRGVTTANAGAVPVVIDSAGQLGTVSSSRRFKDEIKPMDQTSEAILGLKPVTFHYKNDKQNTPQFGLIAEEVAKVNPDLVVRDEDEKVSTVRYEAVNAMLLNESQARRDVRDDPAAHQGAGGVDCAHRNLGVPPAGVRQQIGGGPAPARTGIDRRGCIRTREAQNGMKKGRRTRARRGRRPFLLTIPCSRAC